MSLVTFSCTKNLDQQPQSTATKDAIFGSEGGLSAYTLSFYDMLPSIGDPFRTDCNLSDYGATSSIPTYLTANGYTADNATGWNWTNLRNVNYFIQNCTNPIVPESIRENYLGIARFFRAYFYFDKMKQFGNVPWYSTPIASDDSTDLYKTQDSRTLIMDSIIADMEYAGQHISTEQESTRSTITKWVVYGYLSRFCLFEGTFRKYHPSYGLSGTADALLQKAADAADTVIQSGAYSIYGSDSTSYRSLFTSAAPISSEIMLADVTSSSLSVYNDANWYYNSSTYGSRFSFIKRFINTYMNIDGSRFTDKEGYDTIPFIREMQGRDWRLQQTIRGLNYTVTSNGTNPTKTAPDFSYVYTGYQPIKWVLDDTKYNNAGLNTNSISLMRYAEILLNYAEAKAELGTISSTDWASTIGKIRARAGIQNGLSSLPTVVDNYLQKNYYPDINDPIILEIRRERAIELALEGLRFADLVRWDEGNDVTNTWDGMYVPAVGVPMDLNGDGKNDVCFYLTAPTTQESGVSYIDVSGSSIMLDNKSYGHLLWLPNSPKIWADYKYLYPIPTTVLQKNKNLVQNTGW